MSNRNITINDLDRPDYVPSPERDPIGYDDGKRTRSSDQHARRRVPFGGFLVVALVACVIGLVLAVRLANWLSSEYSDNPAFSTLVQAGLYLVVIAISVSLAVCLLSLALAVFGKAAKAGMLELPGGFTGAHVGDALAGWQRPNVAALAANTMQQHYSVQHTLAAHSQYRNVTSYSPSTSTSTSTNARNDAPNVADDNGGDVPELPSGPVTPFDELLAAGAVGPGQKLLLGIDVATGQQVRGDWGDLYSTIVAGLSGGGKTTTQRFLAAQTVMHGARFVVGDPHNGAADDSLGATLEPLRGAFLCDVAETEKSVLDAVRLVRDIGEQRITGKSSDTTPIILWLDEATRLLGHSTIGPELAMLLEAIAQQYRKRNVYASIAGQIWTAERSGGSSALRDSMASVLCHRMKRSQARMLLPTEEARMVERLPNGQVVLWRTSGETTVLAIPNTTAASLRAVGARLVAGGIADAVADSVADNQARAMGFQRPASASNQPAISQVQMAGYSAPESAKAASETSSAEDARIVALFLAGNDYGAIVAEMYGLKSNGGQAYIKKLHHVQSVIRAVLQSKS